jgi:hypothetical protein
MVVKPSNCLRKGLLLGILVQRLAQVATYREHVLHAAEEVDLIWLTSLNQDFFRLVANLGVKTSSVSVTHDYLCVSVVSSNTRIRGVESRGNIQPAAAIEEWLLNSAKLLIREEGGVGNINSIEVSVLQEASNVLQESSIIISKLCR